jgi:hypothetical protein
MDDVTKIVLSGVVGFIVGIFTRWPLEKLAERRAFVQSVTDRYLEAARADSRLQEEEFLRVGTLQSVGAAELRRWEFSRVCRRIAARGFRDPRHREIPIFTDRRRHLRPLLRWAARESINLAEADTLFRIAAEEADAQTARRPSHT